MCDDVNGEVVCPVAVYDAAPGAKHIPGLAAGSLRALGSEKKMLVSFGSLGEGVSHKVRKLFKKLQQHSFKYFQEAFLVTIFRYLFTVCRDISELKGKIVSELSHFFALFDTFSEFYPRTFPFKTKVLAQ